MSRPRGAHGRLRAVDGDGQPSESSAVQPAAAAATRAGQGRLTVAGARLVPCEKERWLEARRALRVLYRDFLTGGGLDDLGDRRSHADPAEEPGQRRVA